MWSSVDVSLNQVQFSTSGTNYMYQAAIGNILSYSKSTKELQLSLIGMTTDTANFNSSKTGEGNAILGVNLDLLHINSYLEQIGMVVVNLLDLY